MSIAYTPFSSSSTSLLFLRSRLLVLHIYFASSPAKGVGIRMLDHRIVDIQGLPASLCFLTRTRCLLETLNAAGHAAPGGPWERGKLYAVSDDKCQAATAAAPNPAVM